MDAQYWEIGDPEAEDLGRGAAGADVDGDGLPQPEWQCVRRALLPYPSSFH